MQSLLLILALLQCATRCIIPGVSEHYKIMLKGGHLGQKDLYNFNKNSLLRPRVKLSLVRKSSSNAVLMSGIIFQIAQTFDAYCA